MNITNTKNKTIKKLRSATKKKSALAASAASSGLWPEE